MTTFDFAAEARRNSARAAGYTRRAEKDAHNADEAYQAAAHWRRLARRSHQLSFETAAERESHQRTWTHVGDTYLRASFHSTGMAEFYRDLAARNRASAKRYAE